MTDDLCSDSYFEREHIVIAGLIAIRMMSMMQTVKYLPLSTLLCARRFSCVLNGTCPFTGQFFLSQSMSSPLFVLFKMINALVRLLRRFLDRCDAARQRNVDVPLFALLVFDIVDAGLDIAKVALYRA